MKAVIMQAADGDNTVEVVNWLDMVPGIVYSLSTVQPDVNGLDLTAIAEQIYIPMQGEHNFDENCHADSERRRLCACGVFVVYVSFQFFSPRKTSAGWTVGFFSMSFFYMRVCINRYSAYQFTAFSLSFCLLNMYNVPAGTLPCSLVLP